MRRPRATSLKWPPEPEEASLARILRFEKVFKEERRDPVGPRVGLETRGTETIFKALLPSFGARTVAAIKTLPVRRITAPFVTSAVWRGRN